MKVPKGWTITKSDSGVYVSHNERFGITVESETYAQAVEKANRLDMYIADSAEDPTLEDEDEPY